MKGEDPNDFVAGGDGDANGGIRQGRGVIRFREPFHIVGEDLELLDAGQVDDLIAEVWKTGITVNGAIGAHELLAGHDSPVRPRHAMLCPRSRIGQRISPSKQIGHVIEMLHCGDRFRTDVL